MYSGRFAINKALPTTLYFSPKSVRTSRSSGMFGFDEKPPAPVVVETSNVVDIIQIRVFPKSAPENDPIEQRIFESWH